MRCAWKREGDANQQRTLPSRVGEHHWLLGSDAREPRRPHLTKVAQVSSATEPSPYRITPMWLYLVRHAQSEANAGVPGAPVDCELTALGRSQAEATAARLAHFTHLDLILCSPYIRALETATAIHRATGAPLAVFPPIHEHHISPFPATWPLLDRGGLATRFPHLHIPDDFPTPGWHNPPETDAQTLSRMGVALASVRERFATDPDRASRRVCLVSHGSPTGKMVMAFLGQASADPDIRIDNASITILDDTPGRRAVRGINWADHLPERTS